MQLIHRLTICLSLLLSAPAGAESAYPDTHWSSPPPALRAAWNQARLQAADRIAEALWTDAYLVIHRGYLIHGYGELHKPMNIASVRKSVLGILIGIAVWQGRIDLNQSLTALGIDDTGGLSAREKTATVRQLLQARSGVYHPAAYETRVMEAETPPRDSHAPGSFWYYNNWDFNTLGAIYQQCTGHTVFESLDTQLARPLQFEDFHPASDTQFVYAPVSRYPAYVMKLSASDLARIGLLMSRSGNWRGHQLLPAGWISESTRAASIVHAGRLGYGYLWWTARSQWPFWPDSGLFFGWGDGGQFLLVDPTQDLVIVHQIDLSRFDHGNVSPEGLGLLLEQIVAAAPPKP